MRQAKVHHKEGGGEWPAAYFTDIPLPWVHPYKELFCRIHYGCNGLPIGRLKTWYRFSFEPLLPGDKTEFTSFGFLRFDDKKYYGMIVDVRSPELMMLECCPPAITNELLGTEGIPG